MVEEEVARPMRRPNPTASYLYVPIVVEPVFASIRRLWKSYLYVWLPSSVRLPFES